MKKLSFILSLLCLTCSMSFGQILQWTKTITAPRGTSSIASIQSVSKTTLSAAVIVNWSGEFNGQELIWFGNKGVVIHSEVIMAFPGLYFYGSSNTRIVLGGGIGYVTYTRKGSIVTKTNIDAGTLVSSMPTQFQFNASRDAGIAVTPALDQCGFFSVEKGEGDTWILKRYIF